MKNLYRKAIVIGETRVCVQCIEYLLKNNWEVIYLISEDKAVLDWGKEHSIKLLPISQLSTIEESNFYLFSIINRHIIPESFLKSGKIILALNYHDAPLPRYAGAHSTTWAIINGEQEHGITIHQISSGIDEGDIVSQSLFPIEKQETAISLDIKCSEHLLTIFKEVITKLEHGSLEFIQQDLSKRTYHSLKDLPANYGIINGITDLKLIDRLARGLTFGEGYDNPITTVKAYIKGKFYIIDCFEEASLRDIYGNKTDLKIQRSALEAKYFLPPEDIQYLSALKVQEKKYKKSIAKFFEENSEASVKVFDNNLDQIDYCTETIQIPFLSSFQRSPLSFPRRRESSPIPENISIDTVLAIACLVLIRFFRDDFVASLYLEEDWIPSCAGMTEEGAEISKEMEKSIPFRLRNLVEKRNWIYLNHDLLKNSFDKLEQYVVQAKKDRYVLVKDFGYRYGLSLLTDIAITIGSVEVIDRHQLIIEIKDKLITVKGATTHKIQITSIAEAVATLLSQDIRGKDLRYVNLLNESQYNKVVYEWNQTERPYPKDKTIHQLFEEQVLRTPNNIAIVFEDKKLTYHELNTKANQLAHYLLTNYKIQPEDLIVLCLERSELILIAILAVLKAGGAYVPIDPSYPEERIKYILGDTKARIVVTNNRYKKRFLLGITEKNNINLIFLDNQQTQNQLSASNSSNPTINLTSHNLAYIIYTSGTTGNPKGVMIEHKGVANYINYLIELGDLNVNSRGSQYSNFGFDAAIIDTFPILLSGGTLYIISEANKLNLAVINEFFIQNAINYAFLPTKVAEIFLELKNTSLKNLIVGGDKLQRFISQSYRVINAYGPTEATVESNYFIVNKHIQNIPIGKPIANVTNYVLDKSLNLLPIGTIGELYIGGAGLARGYLNQPELTAERFILNPFSSQSFPPSSLSFPRSRESSPHKKNERIYKTGDLVRWLPDGNLEYIGRCDEQVKIRGYRIELGEIANNLLTYPDIKQAVVIIHGEAEHKYLVAYYIAKQKLNLERLHAHLARYLPDYMIPKAFVPVSELPLTDNGKINKKLLPIPKLTDQLGYIMPKTKLQHAIVEIWAEVLNIPKKEIGIKDNFFNLGNSLLTISLINKLNKISECRNLVVTDIFKYPTIEQLTNFITNSDSEHSSKQIYPNGWHLVNSPLSERVIARRLCGVHQVTGPVQQEPTSDEVQITNTNIETDIAIIAMSGAFSGSENIEQYWGLIQFGINSIKHYTPEECRALGIPEEVINNPNFIAASGHVPNIDQFDAEFWKLTPNEAKVLDPQIRKFLEHCWYALDIAGYLEVKDRSRVGVFAGCGKSVYTTTKFKDNFLSIRDLNKINSKDILATKISYLLGLTGPAYNISTACSTSLVTVIEACQQLSLGTCDMALAGGVSLLMPEEVGYIYKEGLIYAKDGYCRVFDDAASGTIAGSGVGVVLLKRLSEAQQDKDHIIAVIKGYATNNDGNHKISFTAPSIDGQKECILTAQKMAGISSDMIDYVECHGTGTKLGDPIEVQALHEAFQINNPHKLPHQCVIGSVKANIGHTDSAAGIAGLIKLCNMLQHNILPKQINYSQPNTELHLDKTNFKVLTENQSWQVVDEKVRLAGLSSFGIGGTNAHLVISEYPLLATNNESKKEEDTLKNTTPDIKHRAKNKIGFLSGYHPSYRFARTSYWEHQQLYLPTETPKPKQLQSSQDFSVIKSKVREQNLPEKYYPIAKVFLDELGIDKISVHEDLLDLGVDSLGMVNIVAELQKNYAIGIDDFMKLRTIAKVADYAPYIENNLIKRLNEIKALYVKKTTCRIPDVEAAFDKQEKYLQTIKELNISNQKKSITHVLLTGATGHVGCNILEQLLHETTYNIYLPIRAKSYTEAYARIKHRFNYYFDLDLDNYRNRIIVLVSDLEQSDLGLDKKDYQELITKVDSIIHSAALVKHYGTYEEAYQANVQTTINLLELARLTANKDFHYISTLGVLVQSGYIPNCSYYAFHEDDDAGIIVDRDNIYAKTKYEGELVVDKYRTYGITGNIYRLGNVAMHSITARHQENIADNAFFIQLQTMVKLGILCHEIAITEISPVDLTAKAIVKLFEQVNCSNQTHHISNPYLYDLSKFFINNKISITILPIEKFIDKISQIINSNDIFSDTVKQLKLFMLHQGWLRKNDVNFTKIKILQDKTISSLAKLGFAWSEIGEDIWRDVIKRI